MYDVNYIAWPPLIYHISSIGKKHHVPSLFQMNLKNRIYWNWNQKLHPSKFIIIIIVFFISWWTLNESRGISGDPFYSKSKGIYGSREASFLIHSLKSFDCLRHQMRAPDAFASLKAWLPLLFYCMVLLSWQDAPWLKWDRSWCGQMI